ncbi:MAG: Holliday junction branch migration protein RuvA [Candidatus Paceibacterota bacterium]
MIRQISGVVTDIGISFVVVDVGGVGYLVHTNCPTSYLIDAPARLFTHLAVRENSLDLYGFIDRDTLEIFELLIDLPKIGPKSALQILTQADVSLLKESVLNDDPAYLSKLSGIGKKSAEKIVSGLKDKFESRGYEDISIKSSRAAPTHTSDTIDALIALGYPAMDARRIVLEIAQEDPSLTSSADTIKIALKLLNNH